MTWSAVIVDDEPLARERIRQLLDPLKDTIIAAECGDGRTAVERIRDLKPDVVFLDVQMPGLSGMDVVAQLGDDVPFIVFVTAYDQYAIKAFELHALDYLLKPFDRKRFSATVERIRRYLSRPPASGRAGLKALVEAWQKDASDRLIVKDGGRIHTVRISGIDWIEAAGNYVELHCGNTSHLMRETLSRLAKRLAPHRFIRIHRSTMVNLDRVRELKPLANGDYQVVLDNRVCLTLSRTYRSRLAQLRSHPTG